MIHPNFFLLLICNYFPLHSFSLGWFHPMVFLLGKHSSIGLYVGVSFEQTLTTIRILSFILFLSFSFALAVQWLSVCLLTCGGVVVMEPTYLWVVSMMLLAGGGGGEQWRPGGVCGGPGSLWCVPSNGVKGISCGPVQVFSECCQVGLQ